MFFCAAGPSYEKSCPGCSSDNTDQTRKGKWNCKNSLCCYQTKYIDCCTYCEDFPYKAIDKKLIKSFDSNNRFKYRHKIPETVEKLKLYGIDVFIE